MRKTLALALSLLAAGSTLAQGVKVDPKPTTYKTVPGSGGVSPAPNELEGIYAWNWAQNIWADTLL